MKIMKIMKALSNIRIMTLSCILAGLFFSIGTFGQSVLPGEVKSAFDKKFGQAKEVKWSKENAKEWEAEFTLGGKDMSASFDPSGKWIETETEMKLADFPATVRDAIQNKFPDYTISESVKIEKPGFSGYQAELKKGKEVREVVFSGKGEIVSQKTEKAGNEKDED